ncbi:BTB/POZ domain-containing protein DOT3-like isoform X2 [Telopea speciosissima]|uniref:BTB/POZ domain-containing protein DOT3-like isoform X2 n=1 Tax=Telopea speciosissima TaxID=54955 RepID=UPI001CC4C12C|nr:BTB/POZ domain-containing protein DOT3-like isoform X2 [Telopea speciosissima]
MGAIKNSSQFSLLESHHSDSSTAIPVKLITATVCFEKKEQAWFVTSKVPTDLTIQVGDITFYAHKHPLTSRSGYFNRIDLEKPLKFGNDVKLNNFPGGSETFENVLKFCYGLPVDLTPTNVAPLRCASEFLEMTEEFEDGNLISKAEAFLTFIVLSSLKNSITVLKSCESLSPWAENLQIIRRCCDTIAWQACRDNLANGEFTDDERWWFGEVSTLRIDHFVRIITTTRAKGAKPEVIGACIMHYAEKWLCGMGLGLEDHSQGSGKHELQLCILSGKRQERSPGYNKEQRVLIESLISILPQEKEAVSCKFLLQMLKMATVYSATPALVSELEKKIGMVLEDANANDLLIPKYRGGDEEKHSHPPSGECTMHDIDSVQRIVEYFLMHEQQRHQQNTENSPVGKLLDNYLAEVARDPNLTISKFQVLAEALPPSARSCDDGLYRAIDTYLKTHPSITEHDRWRLCKLMDCAKLSLDACMHAAQNDRLPLRTIIQVLFSEQLKVREAIQKKEPVPNEITEQESRWTSAEKKIETTKAELEMVKTMLQEMQKDYYELQQEWEKLNIKQKSVSSWSNGWKKLKNSTFFHGKMDYNVTGESHPNWFQSKPSKKAIYLLKVSNTIYPMQKQTQRRVIYNSSVSSSQL